MTTSPTYTTAAPPDPAGNALGTYRALRLGMPLLVGLLGLAVVADAGRSDWCFQTSISAYRFSAISSVFVGVVVALGACLIVYRGNTDTEDVLLDVAGFLALVVAVVPTGRPGPGCAAVVDDTASASGVRTSVAALLVTAVVAVIVAWLLRRRSGIDRRSRTGIAARILGAAIVGVVVVTFAFPDFFLRYAHGYSAVTLFVLIGLVVACNAYLAARQHSSWKSPYAVVYTTISAAMILTAAVVVVVHLWTRWPYAIFVVEAALLAEFAAFWLVQTKELWNVDDRRCLISSQVPLTPL
ncbi:hypothetical protein [Gordonia soli]|uniref:DUF998 domain-containing protein n=1 Tax=Gordonia soli NBRC 108243 TaxID=1223545 RepID=M0QLE2_9ACTN|nr:hypothetical protein [Gordonia soli]GAC68227.1 hypothetical protein GS4_14_00580 [Gordonia soli NBRC 108243]